MGEEKKRGRLLPAVLVAVAVIAGICAYAIPKALVGQMVPLPEAIQNTLKETDQLTSRLLPAAKTLDGGSYEIALKGEGNMLSVDAAAAVREETRQGLFQAKVGYDDLVLDGTLTVDGAEVRLQLPGLIGASTLRYSFAEEVNGYLAQLAGEELSQLNSMVLSQLESDTASEFQHKVEEIARRQAESLEFTGAEAKQLTVDGEERTCRGMKTSIPQETLATWVGEYEAVYREYLDATTEMLSSMGEAAIDWDETDAQIDELLAKITSLDIEYYIYRQRLAELTVSVPEKAKLDMLIQGGTTPLEHVTVQLDGVDGQSVTLVREGSVDGKTEIVSYFKDNDLVLKREYQTESGQLDVAAQEAEFHGSLWEEDGALHVRADRLVRKGRELGFTGECTVRPKTDLTLPEVTGKLYDLNTMQEGDFMPLMFEVYGSELFQKLP